MKDGKKSLVGDVKKQRMGKNVLTYPQPTQRETHILTTNISTLNRLIHSKCCWQYQTMTSFKGFKGALNTLEYRRFRNNCWSMFYVPFWTLQLFRVVTMVTCETSPFNARCPIMLLWNVVPNANFVMVLATNNDMFK